MPAKRDKGDAVLAVNSQQRHLNAATKQSVSVIKMSKHTHSEGFRIQLHSKCFERLKIKLYMYLLNNFSSTSKMSKSILTMLSVLKIIKKIKNLKEVVKSKETRVTK